jgi:hypothetical protein
VKFTPHQVYLMIKVETAAYRKYNNMYFILHVKKLLNITAFGYVNEGIIEWNAERCMSVQ